MPKLPDVSGYSFDELSRLVSLATKRMDEIRGKRIKELQAELGRLGAEGDPAPRRAGRMFGPMRLAPDRAEACQRLWEEGCGTVPGPPWPRVLGTRRYSQMG